MRKDLRPEDLGDLFERAFNATLATYRQDGTVLLSPVWHEWSNGGFSVITGAGDVKLRHIERTGRAAIVLADNDPPYRGIEITCSPRIERDPNATHATFERVAARYLGQQRGRAYVESSGEDMVVIRLEPGRVRAWDFSDDELLG